MSAEAANKLNGRRNAHDSSNEEAAVSVRTLGLTKVFPANKLSSLLRLNTLREGKVAVDNLNMHVPRGAIYGYLGPNGAGKTTTIRMLVGLLRPTRGTASICGHTIHDDLRGAQQHAGYMPDAISGFPPMKAVEFLTLFGELSGLSKDTARRRALELLSWGDLEDRTALNTKVNKWSAGMQRKLLLIQAILHNPDVLLFDEPTANLDPVARRELIELLKQVTKGDAANASDRGWGTTVFLSSHDLPEVQEVCTHMGFIRRGHLVAEGSKSELFKSIGRLATDRTAVFVVSGRGMREVAKRVEKKLDARIIELRDDRMEVSTKSGEKLFKVLADAVENIGDSAVTDMMEKEDTLEDVFLRLSKTTKEDKEGGA